LQDIFQFENERWVNNDWVIQYRGRHLQLQLRIRRYGPTQAKALVCEWEDGGIEVRYRGQQVEFKELTASGQQNRQPQRQETVRASYRTHRPAKKDHPCRQGYDRKLLPPGESCGEFGARCAVRLRYALNAPQGCAPADTTTTTANQKKKGHF
jgi:hypothetical protein